MAKRLRDSGGRVFLHCTQLADRKGFTEFSTDDEQDFETVDATPKRKKKKVAKKKAAAPAPEKAAPADDDAKDLDGWE